MKSINPGENKRPGVSEIEISIFGGGFGESIIIHLGNNRWCVIDSCLDWVSGEPIALKYFKSIGVNPENIELVLVTHWHDDHLRGISEVLRYADTARFYRTACTNNPEFWKAAYADTIAHQLPKERKLSEIRTSCELTENRQTDNILAQDSLVLLRGDVSTPSSVIALSPSHTAVQLGFKSILNQIGFTDGMPTRRIPKLSPNETSVVCILETSGGTALLGADLEDHPDANRGWNAVMSSIALPGKPSTIFKVAHHGSINGQNTNIWVKLIDQNPILAITPYNKGSQLPTDADVRRMKGLTNQVYLTNAKHLVKPPKHDPLSKTKKEACLRRQVYNKKIGHIRIRFPSTDISRAKVALFDDATQV